MVPAANSTDRRRRSGIEENTLVILDEAHDTQYSHDDRLGYLEAVRVASLLAENGTPPTYKMLEAVFGIFRRGKSLELIMASFQLLNELEKRFPRVYAFDGAATESSLSSQPKLVVDKEAWSPFALSSDSASTERATASETSARPIDPSGFQILVENLLEAVDSTDVQELGLEPLRNMLLFQHLVEVLEGEYLCRYSIYKETKDWTILREFTLNMLLGSRRVSHKNLMKDCLAVLCRLHHILSSSDDDLIDSEVSVAKSSKICDTSMAIALLEMEESTSISMQKLMAMIMELDALKKEADLQGYTTRADGVRTPLAEIVLDELTYDKEILSPFLQVFNQPKWKLELILQYFLKYNAKPSVRTRRSNETTDVTTFDSVLKSLSNVTSAKSIVKKIGVDVVQVLLAHGFQAHFALSHKCNSADGKTVGNSSLMRVCRDMVSAFKSLRKTYEHMDMLPIAKEALFAAATILSTKS